jgi:hypothetical protein
LKENILYEKRARKKEGNVKERGNKKEEGKNIYG